MNILVTAGNTQTPLDRVRCITNIFTGRTGATIATHASSRGHTVTMLTSHPEVLDPNTAIRVRSYRTYEDLDNRMAEEITSGQYQAIIHAAAVSDYHTAGIFSMRDGQLEDASAGKVKSHHAELWVKLVPAPKLVDKIRSVWGFRGTLVKFKLEVGLTEAELLEVAERSRVQSDANLMCANTLEGMQDWALIGRENRYDRVPRSELAKRLLDAIVAI